MQKNVVENHIKKQKIKTNEQIEQRKLSKNINEK